MKATRKATNDSLRIEPSAEFDPDPEAVGLAIARAEGAKNGNAPHHLRLGRYGEQLACRHLWRNGFRIVARNVRGRRGEIDIIAERRDRLHFVEVKTLSSSTMGLPEDRVDAKKRERLRETAREYLDGFREPPPGGSEFDVLTLVLDNRGRVVSRELIEDAF